VNKKKALRSIGTVAVGLLGVILFRWTPTTGRDVAEYVALLALLVFLAIIVFPAKSGYWPKGPDDH
jgi:uncharacterized membrane protein YccC